MKRLPSGIAVVMALAVFSTTAALSDEEASLREQSQNPVADLISLPFQNNTSFGVGPDDGVSNVLNIQPVVPVNLTDDWTLISRTIVPLIYLSGDAPGGARFGLGDINITGFLSPAGASEVIWGIGPSITIPSATNTVLGSEKWSAGPAAVVLTIQGPVVAGALVNQQFSFAGDDGRRDVSALLIQPFVNYNFDGGWYLVSAPIITANWEASDGERWTVPVGGGGGRVFTIGQQPVNVSLQAYYNAAAPRNGGDWSTRFQVQLLFPK